MITTKDIDVDLEKDKVNLNQKTTKEIDVSFKPAEAKKETEPKKVTRPHSISTHTMQDIADILDKKKRDDIMAEMKKDEKKLTINKKGEANKGFGKGDAVYQKEENIKKKPWNKMNAKERKEYQAEKVRRKKEK